MSSWVDKEFPEKPFVNKKTKEKFSLMLVSAALVTGSKQQYISLDSIKS